MTARPPKTRQKLLWQGAHYMNGNQAAELSEPLSKQPNGLVLIWSALLEDGTPQDGGLNAHFVPRYVLSSFSGKGFAFHIDNYDGSKQTTKYLYVHDDQLKGHDKNTQDGYVLREVWGV